MYNYIFAIGQESEHTFLSLRLAAIRAVTVRLLSRITTAVRRRRIEIDVRKYVRTKNV